MTTENQVIVKHEIIKLSGTYESFIAKIATLVKKLDVQYTQHVATEPKKTDEYLKALEKETGLIIFHVQNHGDLLAMVGNEGKQRDMTLVTLLSPFK